MQKDLRSISDYWQEIYSRQVKEYQPFIISEDFKKFASIFALGNSYLYIVNLHNFELEYISDSVQRFVDKDAGDIEIKDLLQTVISEEIALLISKVRSLVIFTQIFLKKSMSLPIKICFLIG